MHGLISFHIGRRIAIFSTGKRHSFSKRHRRSFDMHSVKNLCNIRKKKWRRQFYQQKTIHGKANKCVALELKNKIKHVLKDNIQNLINMKGNANKYRLT